MVINNEVKPIEYVFLNFKETDVFIGKPRTPKERVQPFKDYLC